MPHMHKVYLMYLIGAMLMLMLFLMGKYDEFWYSAIFVNYLHSINAVGFRFT
jgi:hypothetical protein